jgi:probable F420-dependent oxidoreductase
MFPGHVLGRIPVTEIVGWATEVEALGYDHIAVGDHPVGICRDQLGPAELERWERDWHGPPGSAPYAHDVVFAEPFTLFGYLAATCALEMVTVSLVLPQRQTALVAKQAADLDHLAPGRLRMCVGAGWSSLEFQALGADFARRGRRLDEQIQLLRRFWSEEIVDLDGAFHTVRAAGIQTLPSRGPIPVWTAGDGPAALVRCGRLADGWIPPFAVAVGEQAGACLATIREAAREAGRDPDSLGLEPMVAAALLDDAQLRERVDAWRRHGATHLLINTAATRLLSGPGQSADLTMDDHLAVLRRAATVLRIR